ncbi:hypothetical protein [Desulfosporosinus sp. BICA1-9]|uniref:hypothetical protein n=1 Tax=Desulfosporosinus sp. BICA1-9 TaxID=1531958 RepID=UPI000B316793|nr:hypothetical protein [Desulfosporosinus sp. BICA1-9]
MQISRLFEIVYILLDKKAVTSKELYENVFQEEYVKLKLSAEVVPSSIKKAVAF